MSHAEDSLAETIAKLEEENARDEARLKARHKLLSDLRQTYARYKSSIDDAPQEESRPSSVDSVATNERDAGGVASRDRVQTTASSENSDIRSDLTSRTQSVRRILKESSIALSTQDIIDRLVDLGDPVGADKGAAWRTVDSILRRGAKPHVGVFRKVGTARWEATEKLRGSSPFFKF